MTSSSKGKEVKQNVVFHTRFPRVNLSEFLHAYKCKASNELETVKDEIRKCGDEVGFEYVTSLDGYELFKKRK